jgi:drug/metabolite transporter (DMT)-like permease
MLFNLALDKLLIIPLQVLGKSAKPIPVMILGVLLARKRYPLKKYLFVLMIVIGVALFLYKDRKTDADDSHFFGLGELLLVQDGSLIISSLLNLYCFSRSEIIQSCTFSNICFYFSVDFAQS